jgi:hypothetical protein
MGKGGACKGSGVKKHRHKSVIKKSQFSAADSSKNATPASTQAGLEVRIIESPHFAQGVGVAVP